MAHSYVAVLWNRQKKLYDVLIMIGVLFYLIGFIVISQIFKPEITEETLIIRGTGSLAIILLHIILAIGPMARFHRGFLPLLYNRRHLGVTMFILAAIHGIFSILQFHSLGNVNPLVSLFISNTNFGSLHDFPFQLLGFFALLIFFLMAITSHDFWLANLGPRFWKALHMMVYIAYALVVLHVLLGIVQSEPSILLVGLMAFGLLGIIGLHLLAGFKEAKTDKEKSVLQSGYVLVGDAAQIPENRAVTVVVGGEKVAIFKYNNKLSAVSNVCKHQLGPLGEGKIVDGCITCPWHGYQYLPENGCSPPPFDEKVNTYDLKLDRGKIYLNPKPFPEGTPRPPAMLNNDSNEER